MTEIVTPVNMGNRPHRDNGEGVTSVSPLPSDLSIACGPGIPSAACYREVTAKRLAGLFTQALKLVVF